MYASHGHLDLRATIILTGHAAYKIGILYLDMDICKKFGCLLKRKKKLVLLIQILKLTASELLLLKQLMKELGFHVTILFFVQMQCDNQAANIYETTEIKGCQKTKKPISGNQRKLLVKPSWILQQLEWKFGSQRRRERDYDLA